MRKSLFKNIFFYTFTLVQYFVLKILIHQTILRTIQNFDLCISIFYNNTEKNRSHTLAYRITISSKDTQLFSKIPVSIQMNFISKSNYLWWLTKRGSINTKGVLWIRIIFETLIEKSFREFFVKYFWWRVLRILS